MKMLLFFNKNKWSPDACYNMDETLENITLSEKKWSHKGLYGVWFHLYAMYRKDQSIKTK